MSVSVDDAVEVVTFGMWWPDGEPGTLRDRARAWRRMAAALAEAHEELLSTTEAVRSSNEGAAIDAYADHDRRLRGHVLDVAEACQCLARDLDEFADELEDAQRQVRRWAAEIAATVSVGIGLAILTAGLSASASAAVTATMVARAGVLARLVGQRAVDIAARTAATALVGAAEGAAADLLVQAVPQLTFTDNANPFDQIDLDLHRLGLSGAGGALTGGAFGAVQAVRMPPLPKVGAWRGVRGATGPPAPGLIPLDDIDDIATRISRGHAFDKHVLGQGDLAEVGGRDELADLVRQILRDPDDVTPTARGGSAHWDARRQVVVLHNPADPDLGTVFRPRDGYDYFRGERARYVKSTGDR